jgi:UDP-N-acetylglucosamine 2-epimerase
VRIVTIVGARPQFIKIATVSRELGHQHEEIIVHTGQHYDYELSRVFFKDLELPEPHYNLGVGSGTHGFQTGHGIIRIEEVLLKERPDLVLLYGDTNATLAGALAAAKLKVPIAHVEAGVRLHDKTIPEEINRLVTDHLCDLLFCPTITTVSALRREGITLGVHLVGDVMLDTLLSYKQVAIKKSKILQTLGIKPQSYYLATVHRPRNTDNRARLEEIFYAFQELDYPVVLPLHPRTKRCLMEHGLLNTVQALDNLLIIKPLGYLDFLMLEQHARLILTDSGGVQREAYFLGVPCVTLKELSPWPETVHDGWNVIAEITREEIVQTVVCFECPQQLGSAFGDGTASRQISEILTQWSG